ncbi:plant invertase/pectin methylesterase inhibitor [Striga asiatica]|uniref:pectinesterase n=1 Tax=Striga asiatica TaxID=4170 RepID=A0A5A7PRE6_STRAF|nr:plant invertase/pectin methylesterase inhibitor [Striga asiatica]
MPKVISNHSITLPLLFFLLFSFPFILPSKQTTLPNTDKTTKKDISWWCHTAPHPGPCNRLITAKSEPLSIDEFRSLTIRAALARATEARAHAARLGCRSKSRRRKLVCRECIGLLDDTIAQLTAALRRTSAGPDAQTLAAGGAHSGGFGTFPGWVTRRERKLIMGGDAELALREGVVVSKDGKGHFGTVQEGIEYAVGRRRIGEEGRVVVYVRRGVYEENVVVNRTMANVTLVGEGVRYTVITGNRSVLDGFTTYSSATVGVDGPGFMARGITFRNTAGPNKGQAVALRSASDLSVFYACAFEGYQDTLYVQSQRQFYKSCLIYGTIDIIFGNAAAVLQNCVIYVRRPLPGQANMVTAQGRGDPFQNTGISIHRCRVVPDPDLRPVFGSFRTYLGRPWQQYSRTVVMKTYLDELVAPEGWSAWGDSDFALASLYYGEYRNFGPGADMGGRVRWPGYRRNMSVEEAARFSVAGLIAGREWLPETGVPFTAGLTLANMELKLKLLALTLLSLSSLFPSASPKPTPNIASWCDQTPYPDPCKYFLSHKPFTRPPAQNKSDFRKLAVRLALERAVLAGGHAKSLGPECRDARERAAWADCVQLYDNAVAHLNRTADPTIRCTESDSQTWLSAALTDLETCRNGFVELGVPDHVLPLILSNNNVSKLICNTLALGSSTNSSSTAVGSYGFPAWVPPGDRRRLLQAGVRPNVVVAQDGSGNFRTIREALDAAGRRSGSGRFVIHVRRGVYRENLEIGNSLRNIMLVGDGMRDTVVTAVTGSGFIARGVTFRNTAGPQNHQAVALRSGSDLSVFYRCAFEGYQDTLYVHSQRQFYRECYVYGTVDFIFGNAAAVLQNCMILPRRPMNGQQIAVTAQGRTDPNQNTGISIHNSRVVPAADLAPVVGSVRVYLGRPWKEYSRTVFMQTYLGSFIDPAGWLEWDGNFALNTLYYGEYRNTGPGSGTARRVRWRGYRVITSPAEAGRFTVGSFIAGRSWLPATGVPFTAGL